MLHDHCYNLRLARYNLGWSQDELAAKSGVHKSTIVNLEKLRSKGAPKTLFKIANVLGVEVWQILSKNGEDLRGQNRRGQNTGNSAIGLDEDPTRLYSE